MIILKFFSWKKSSWLGKKKQSVYHSNNGASFLWERVLGQEIQKSPRECGLVVPSKINGVIVSDDGNV